MGYIEAECKNCGAGLEINEEKGKGYCPHCGTLFVAEKVNQIIHQNITKNIFGADKEAVDEYLQNGDVFLSLEEYDKAKAVFDKAIELNPADWRGWFGMVKVKTKNLTDYLNETHLKDLQKAHSVANDEEDKIIDKLYEQFADTRRAMLIKIKHETTKLDDFYDFADKTVAADKAVASPTAVTKRIVPADVCAAAPCAVKKPKKKRKFLKFIISLAIIISIIAVVSSAVGNSLDWFGGRDFTFVENQTLNGMAVSKYNGSETTIEVPRSHNFKDVIIIGTPLATNDVAYKIRKIEIPKTVRYIDFTAFSNCYNLQSIRLKGSTPPDILNLYNSNANSFLPNSNVIIYVPNDAVTKYKNDSDWYFFRNNIRAYT